MQGGLIMYDDVHDGVTMQGNVDGMNLLKVNSSSSVLSDANFVSDGVFDGSLCSEGSLPVGEGIQDEWHADVLEGNGEELLAYPDPLAHAGEFHPNTFELNNAETSIDFGMPEVQESDASSVISYAMSSDGGLMPAWNDVNEFSGVENGMLSDPSQLNELIAAGEVQGAIHVSAEDEVRSETVIKNFLHEHGYTDVPAGYEIHHIVPLGEGGADDPHNMVLLTEEQHDAITTAHRQYYGW